MTSKTSKPPKSKEDFEAFFHQPGTFPKRFARMLKSSLGTKKAFDKMCTIVRSLDYLNLEDADKSIDWNKAKTVTL